MFCPNCGNNCADANFCPKCGRELCMPVASDAARCPQCASTSITVRERLWRHRIFRDCRTPAALLVAIVGAIGLSWRGHKNGGECVCAKCGYTWYTRQEEQKKVSRRRYRQYILNLLEGTSAVKYPSVGDAYLVITETELQIYRASVLKHTIPYDKITAVDYQKNLGPLYGWLAVREETDRKRPFPKTFHEAEKDSKALFYTFEYTNNYHELFSSLKAIAEKNRKTGISK